jgi:hypothetical protein
MSWKVLPQGTLNKYKEKGFSFQNLLKNNEKLNNYSEDSKDCKGCPDNAPLSIHIRETEGSI